LGAFVGFCCGVSCGILCRKVREELKGPEGVLLGIFCRDNLWGNFGDNLKG